MKSVRVHEFGSPSTHRIEKCEEPALSDRDVLVGVHTIGVNYPDLLIIRGQYQSLPAFPFTPGTDAAGVVLATGTGVTRFKPGDRVLAIAKNGAFASHLVAQEHQCFPLPDSVAFDTAAAMGMSYLTAYLALVQRAAFAPGEVVLITGATGSVGTAATQIVKALGGKVLAGVNSAARAEIAIESGADKIIDLSTADIRTSMRDQVHAATNGRGADIVLEPLGGDYFDAAIRSLAWEGRLVVIGFASGRIADLKTNYVLLKTISVTGLQFTDYRDRTECVAQAHDHLMRLHAQGTLKPRLHVFAFEDFAAAMDMIDQRRSHGRVVLQVEG